MTLALPSNLCDVPKSAEWVTIDEAATLLGVTKKTIHAWIRREWLGETRPVYDLKTRRQKTAVRLSKVEALKADMEAGGTRPA